MHVSEIVKKASKRLYFLRQLKRAHFEKALLLRFYTSCIRSVCDYAIPVFHASLPQYLIDDLERVQKRALSIIMPHLILRQRSSFVRPRVVSGSPSPPLSVPFQSIRSVMSATATTATTLSSTNVIPVMP